MGLTRSRAVVQLNAEVDEVLVPEPIAQGQDVLVGPAGDRKLADLVTEGRHRSDVLVDLGLELKGSADVLEDL